METAQVREPMADPGQGAGTIQKAPVCGDVKTVQFDGKGEEGRIVEGEAWVPAQPRGAPQEGGGRRSNDEWKGFQMCFRQEILVTRLEPLDEDRGVNDELRGRIGSRGSSG